MVSLTVGTTGAEDYMRIFQDVSELARNMVDTHEYVNVSAQLVDTSEEDEEPGCDHEKLHYDEYTLVKVHRALTEALSPYGMNKEAASYFITAMQNAGILFRERTRQPMTDEAFAEVLDAMATYTR
jgi:hypothetical protein